jgi:hypothetical protein
VGGGRGGGGFKKCSLFIVGVSNGRIFSRIPTQVSTCKQKMCLDRGSNTGPLDLQSNALPTELSKQLCRQQRLAE